MSSANSGLTVARLLYHILHICQNSTRVSIWERTRVQQEATCRLDTYPEVTNDRPVVEDLLPTAQCTLR